MGPDPKPYLLIDVDGVLAPVRASATPPGFTPYTVRASDGQDYEVWLNPDHGEWLNSLHKRFELVWATAWEHNAARLLGPIFGLPSMRVIEFTRRPSLDSSWKLPDVIDFIGEAPTAWIDDYLDSETEQWAERRGAPTLLIRTDGSIGLTREHVEQLVDFSKAVDSHT